MRFRGVPGIVLREDSRLEPQSVLCLEYGGFHLVSRPFPQRHVERRPDEPHAAGMRLRPEPEQTLFVFQLRNS